MNLAADHRQNCATLAAAVSDARSRGERIGLRKSTSNLFRQRSSRGKYLIDVRGFNRVLEIDEQIAARVYERALDALQDARNAAAQQSIYLAAFVRPALPQDSTYPIRWRVMLETALISFAAWCLLQLLYHGIRDHID